MHVRVAIWIKSETLLHFVYAIRSVDASILLHLKLRLVLHALMNYQSYVNEVN